MKLTRNNIIIILSFLIPAGCLFFLLHTDEKAFRIVLGACLVFNMVVSGLAEFFMVSIIKLKNRIDIMRSELVLLKREMKKDK